MQTDSPLGGPVRGLVHLTLAAAFFLGLTASTHAVAAATPIRVNCGGSAFTTAGGITFSADQYYVGGTSGQNQNIADIKNTSDDTLYRTERIPTTDLGSFSYEFPVANGNYVVLLHEAETWWGATGGPANTNQAGLRVFNVDLEGQRVLSNYDLIADVGTMAGVIKRFDTTVQDGSLSMLFTASVNKPKCSAIEVLPASAPYSGVSPIPGKIEAENYDTGGEGISYHDTTSANEGGQYRLQEAVDLGAITDTGGGYSVGWTKAGEWLVYTVNVAETGTYSVQVRVASEGTGGTFHLEFNGVNKTGTIAVPNTGGWQTWQTLTVDNVSLSAGQQTLRLVMDSEGANGAIANISWLQFAQGTSGGGGGGGGLLRWRPPTLTNPVTINLGTGSSYNKLDNSTDYIIKFPAQKKNGITHLDGGRNIVIIGGYGTAVSGDSERVIYLQNQVGTVHLEGLLLDNSGGRQADAIAIQAPSATVQIQNVRAVGLIGGQSGSNNHSDVVQPWGGVKELRIDHLTGSSNYQGLFIPVDLGPITSATILNTNLYYQNASSGVNEGGYMLWLEKNGCNSVYPVTLSEFYVVPKSTLSLGKSVWPDVQDSSCPAVVSNNQASWPSLPQVSGAVKLGPPAGGDFVPAGKAGLNYVSPGYQ